MLPPAADLRAEFSKVWEEIQRQNRKLAPVFTVLLLVMVTCIGGLAFANQLRLPSHLMIAACSAALVGMFLVLLLAPGDLKCPNCTANIEKKWKHFCSECGTADLIQPKFIGLRIVPQCSKCEAEPVRVGRGRGVRKYKIRYCHNCGSFLSESGV